MEKGSFELRLDDKKEPRKEPQIGGGGDIPGRVKSKCKD